MDVLVIGGNGSLTRGLIDKLHKEGHRIYVLTGSKFHSIRSHKVFEYYYFSYESDSVKEVFRSVNPDVIISLGAFDSVFNWEDTRREAIRYSNSILNMLMAYSMQQKGRFIYLSSEEVYSQSYPNDIKESEAPCPKGNRPMILAQTEQLCLNYGTQMNRDVVVARLDHYCGIPKESWEAGSVCGQLCIQGFKSAVMGASSNVKFAPLFTSDAVEYIYQLIVTPTHEKELYNLSSGMVISEMDMAHMVAKQIGYQITINDDTIENGYRVVLSSEAFKSEFNQQVLFPPERTVERIVGYMKGHRKLYLDEVEDTANPIIRLYRNFKNTFGKLIPFIENFVFFIPFFMLNNRATDSRYFKNLDFYLLYVLLFAIVHGQHQATLSAVLATAGYIFRQMYNRSGFEVLLDYNTYVWIAQLFILGLVVGYMKDQLKLIRSENQQEVDYLNDQVDDIQDINSSNVRMKDVLITQLANQNDSIGKIYDITSSLSRYAPDEVLFYAAEVVSKLMKSNDVAIYSIDHGYARLCSATSDVARQMGNSIKYRELGNFYEVLNSKSVYINKRLEEDRPLMANAVFEGDEMKIIIMIWGIPWDSMTMSQANILSVISLLIRDALVQANRYFEALEEDRYIADTSILDEEAFTSLTKAYMDAKSKGLTECTLLAIDARISIQNSDLITRLLRQTDYLGTMQDNKLFILLANTKNQDANIVIERLAEVGLVGHIQEDLIV